MTAPLFGDMVRVPSTFVTVETAPPPPPDMQAPLNAKHPPVILIPFAKVDVEFPVTVM